MVGIIQLANGAVDDIAMAPYSGKQTGEHALLRELLSSFHCGDVVLGDSYYASFFLIAKLLEMGVDGVFPLHHARHCDFRKGQRLGKKDHLIEWKKPARPQWMDKETYQNFPEKITVRETCISQNRPGFRSQSRVMVTTFLNPKTVSSQDIANLYDHRWLVEVDFRAIKQTMQMDILRCKTPQMVRKEIWAHLLAYNLVRKIMAQAAYRHEKSPRSLSFKLALQVIFSFRQSEIFSASNQDIYEILLQAVAHKKVGSRPGRSEPRKIKRRPKSFPRLQKPRDQYRKKAA